ncbi:MAG: hypothetical protein RIS84_1122 [Pseudomonadota bacterium]|jgi:hypothetical protein
MIEIGDIVQVDYDLTDTPLKMGMLGTVVHQHTAHAYEIEVLDYAFEGCTFAIQAGQVTVVWSVSQSAWLPKRKIAMQIAWHIVKGVQKSFSESQKLAWQNVGKIQEYFGNSKLTAI